jgi:hypothetical protein
VYKAATNTVSLVNSTVVSATHAVWGTVATLSQTAIWGEAVFVNGEAALFGTSALWNQSGIWAATGTQGTATIWGMHAVWGTSATNTGEALATAVNGEN